jgi:hypothetical protein
MYLLCITLKYKFTSGPIGINLDLVWNRRVMIRLNTQQQFLKLSDSWKLVSISLFETR